MLPVYILLVVFALIGLYHLYRGAPYLPTRASAIKNMLALSRVKAGERVVDLGAGDGRIVIAFARLGAYAEGYEHSFFLTWIGRVWIWRTGLHNRAVLYRKDFWNADLSPYDVIVLFGVGHIMERLKEKITREAKPNARIISNTFRFPEWDPVAQEGSIYVYEVPKPSQATPTLAPI